MADEEIPPEVEAAMESMMEELFKAMPLKQFVDSQGPLRFEHWIRRLTLHPEAKGELQRLLTDESGKPRYTLRPDQLHRVMECIERHTVLKSIVDKEWRHFHAHNFRAVLFHELPAPKVKSKEWKKLYGKLSRPH